MSEPHVAEARTIERTAPRARGRVVALLISSAARACLVSRMLRRVLLALAIGSLLTVALAVALASEVGAHQQQQAVHDLDVVLLVDNSRSMLSTDPLGLRVEAARLFVDYLELLASGAGLSPRVAVVSFGGVISLHAPLLPPVSARSALQVEAIEYTDLGLALDTAYADFVQSGTLIRGRRGVVILLTDGRPCVPELDLRLDACASTPEDLIGRYFEREVGDAVIGLQQAGVALYVLGLGEVVQADSERWADLAAQTGGMYQPVVRAEELFSAYRQVLKELLPARTVGPLSLSEGSTALDVGAPYAENVILTFLQEDLARPLPGGRALALEGPLGAILPTPGRVERVGDLSRGYYEIYSLLDPPHGVYTATLEGSDGVRAWVDVVPPNLDVLPVCCPVMLGQAVELSARLLRHGRPVTDSLRMDAMLRLPDGGEARLRMQDVDGDGVFVAKVDTTPLEGAYGLTVVASVGDVEVAR